MSEKLSNSLEAEAADDISYRNGIRALLIIGCLKGNCPLSQEELQQYLSSSSAELEEFKGFEARTIADCCDTSANLTQEVISGAIGQKEALKELLYILDNPKIFGAGEDNDDHVYPNFSHDEYMLMDNVGLFRSVALILRSQKKDYFSILKKSIRESLRFFLEFMDKNMGKPAYDSKKSRESVKQLLTQYCGVKEKEVEKHIEEMNEKSLAHPSDDDRAELVELINKHSDLDKLTRILIGNIPNF